MSGLDCKIPPPVVMIATAILMFAASFMGPMLAVGLAARTVIGLAVALAGVAIFVKAAVQFRQAQTIIDPMTPDKTTAIVSTGVFGFSRNPMYVGQALLLVGWALFLSAPWVLLGPLFFVLYVNRFQILPEERVLAAKFGPEFAAYQAKVRRWL